MRFVKLFSMTRDHRAEPFLMMLNFRPLLGFQLKLPTFPIKCAQIAASTWARETMIPKIEHSKAIFWSFSFHFAREKEINGKKATSYYDVSSAHEREDGKSKLKFHLSIGSLLCCSAWMSDFRISNRRSLLHRWQICSSKATKVNDWRALK